MFSPTACVGFGISPSTSRYSSVYQRIRRHIAYTHFMQNLLQIQKNTKRMRIEHVERKEKGFVHIQWTDDTSCKFPDLFLRDNCQCSQCFHTSSQQRQFDLVATVDVDVRAVDVRHDVENDVVVVRWPDDHRSIFRGDSYMLASSCFHLE